MRRVTLTRPWLTFDLGAEMRVLSWALNKPGFTQAQRILWREVRNKDLPPELDVTAWLDAELRDQGLRDAVCLLTSLPLQHFNEREVSVGDARAYAVTTVGFSNAERVGRRVDRSGKDWGTINVAVAVNLPLTDAALLEMMAIAVQARTAAVMDAGHATPQGIATGTGTDCVAVASLPGDVEYAGMHTELGEAVGRAVYDAVSEGAARWMMKQKETGDAAS